MAFFLREDDLYDCRRAKALPWLPGRAVNVLAGERIEQARGNCSAYSPDLPRCVATVFEESRIQAEFFAVGQGTRVEDAQNASLAAARILPLPGSRGVYGSR